MRKKGCYLITLLSILFLVGCTTSKEEVSNENVSSSEKIEKKETVLYVTRHGKTIFNELGKVQGWSDTPLTEPGVDVAKKLGTGLAKSDIIFESVYSSDSGRARETAKFILEAFKDDNLTINEEENLRELYFGKFEGDLDEDMWDPAAKKLGYKDEQDLKENLKEVGLEKITDTMAELDETKQFESYADVRKRMQEEITRIAKETEKNGGGNVLIVSHGMAIGALLSDWTEENTDRPLPNASISKLIYKDGEFTVETIGDTSFIE